MENVAYFIAAVTKKKIAKNTKVHKTPHKCKRRSMRISLYASLGHGSMLNNTLKYVKIL